MSYIYHYTTLSALIAILQNQQLKLTQLDLFNKLYEPNSFFPECLDSEHRIRQRFMDIFVSSWTKNEVESIAIWKLFSNLENGIRMAINVETAFACSDEENISVHPFYSFGLGGAFRLKMPLKGLHPVDVIECDNCQSEIAEVINFKDWEHSIEEIAMNYERMHKLPYLTGNMIACSDEVRLMIELSVPKLPSNKKALKEYSLQIGNDNQFNYIFVDLPSNFLNDIKIVVSPGFSETNYITLNAFLSKFGYPTAVKSGLTSLYKYFKGTNTIKNL